ncbi:unnamed protein product, partial [Symbiodinium pilosum]
DDQLEVQTEGSVLQAVRHTLWRRLRRAGRSLKLSARLHEAPSLFAQEGLQLTWELMFLEASLSEPGEPSAPPVDRFSAFASAAAVEATAGEGAPLPDLSARLPGDAASEALLRASTEGGEAVRVEQVSLNEQLQNVGLLNKMCA